MHIFFMHTSILGSKLQLHVNDFHCCISNTSIEQSLHPFLFTIASSCLASVHVLDETNLRSNWGVGVDPEVYLPYHCSRVDILP